MFAREDCAYIAELHPEFVLDLLARIRELEGEAVDREAVGIEERAERDAAIASIQTIATALKKAPHRPQGGLAGMPSVTMALNSMAGIANVNTKVDSPLAEPSTKNPKRPAPKPSTISANTGTTVVITLCKRAPALQLEVGYCLSFWIH